MNPLTFITASLAVLKLSGLSTIGWGLVFAPVLAGIALSAVAGAVLAVIAASKGKS